VLRIGAQENTDDVTNSEPKRSDLPIACSLPSPEQVRRRETAVEILGQARKVEEIEDGYAFAFPGSAEWAVRLTEFVVFERACCPFFTFEIFLEPGVGPILLKVRGPEGVKEFIEEDFAGLRLAPPAPSPGPPSG
jgi:hypothetical protein